MPRDSPIAFALEIERLWSGDAAPDAERARVEVAITAERVTVRVDAPYHGDTAPPHPPGSTPGLWEHEVVELMLLGADERYLELEFGPHGHYLALELSGVRNVVRSGMDVTYRAWREGLRWRGEAHVPTALLPATPERVNAFAIHGVGAARRYLAYAPPLGEKPDFHRLDAFVPIAELSSL